MLVSGRVSRHEISKRSFRHKSVKNKQAPDSAGASFGTSCHLRSRCHGGLPPRDWNWSMINMDLKFWGLKKVVPFAENDRLNTLQKSPVSPKGKSSEPIFGFKMCSKNFRGTFCFRNFGSANKKCPQTRNPQTSRNIPNCVKNSGIFQLGKPGGFWDRPGSTR